MDQICASDGSMITEFTKYIQDLFFFGVLTISLVIMSLPNQWGENMSLEVKQNTATIKSCTCKNEYQDEKYGEGMRLMNSTNTGFRCTVCRMVKGAQWSSDTNTPMCMSNYIYIQNIW